MGVLKQLLDFPYKGTCRHERARQVPAIRVDKLTLRYPEASRAVFEDVSFEVQEGSRVALMGDNGSGKSTLIRALASLFPIKKGDVQLFGKKVGSCQHRVVYLPQRSEIDWTFPVSLRELVSTGCYIHLGWFRSLGKTEHARIDSVIESLSLTELAHRQIGELSGGQQQRALLARTLAHDASLFLLDEPLNAVDQYTREVIHAVFDTLKASGKTLLMSTHDPVGADSSFDAVIRL